MTDIFYIKQALERDLTFKPNISVSINGIQLNAQLPDEFTQKYIQRIFGHNSTNSVNEQVHDSSDITIIPMNDELVQEILGDSEFEHCESVSGISLLKSGKRTIYLSDLGFVNIEDRTIEPSKLIGISSLPEIAASTLLRRILLDRYILQFPDLISFHGNAVLNTQTNKSIVFSGTDLDGSLGLSGKKGTTTASLSLVLQPGSQYAFLENDDVIVAPGKSGSNINWLHYPAEINMGEGTLRALQNEGYDIHVESTTYNFWGENHFMTTKGAIEDLGFLTGSTSRGIGIWVFSELSPNKSGLTYEVLKSRDVIRNMLRDAIKKKRMVQTIEEKVLVDFTGSKVSEVYSSIQSKIDESIDRLLENMMSEHTVFIKLDGGVDRNRIYNLINNLEI